MDNYFDGTGTIGFTCDNCGRQLQGCTWVNGMKLCAKCYQETFGASKDWQLLDKDKTIAEQRKQLADLENKLAESEEELKQYKYAYENAMVLDYNTRKWRKIGDIQQENEQLAEKEQQYKESVEKILHYRDRVILEHNQDKISFAVEQLEKVKAFCDGMKWSMVYITQEDTTTIQTVLDEIDNQIKQLKEME